MDLKEIRQIVEMMKRSDLTEFEIEEKDLKLRICRERRAALPVSPYPDQGQLPPAAPVVNHPPAPPTEGRASPGVVEEPGIDFITSPMVGTFYRASSPESPPFVESGDPVSRDSIVCIIEAMKVMNEIQAEVTGTILEALVENGEPVEYGQRLFKIKAE